MNNQEIIDNAPEGATHYDCDEYMRHVHDGFWEYFSKADGWNETKPEEETRSLADIKRIAELESILALVKKDLLMRAEEDSEGFKVVDLSSSIWIKLKEALEEQE